ncbi:Tubulin gamma-1 chain [Datura stramonium]|uniref:Tubulin gamma-1 chain n=1 Tax=Datura stramonium TaxID=4076 RepID=A0ABS8SX31_DATST|nr:Tubulin gamma-1 chain [Datura stramonium]
MSKLLLRVSGLMLASHTDNSQIIKRVVCGFSIKELYVTEKQVAKFEIFGVANEAPYLSCSTRKSCQMRVQEPSFKQHTFLNVIESLVDEYKACESPDYIKWGMEDPEHVLTGEGKHAVSS